MKPKYSDFPIPQRRYNNSPNEKPNYWPVVFITVALVGLALLVHHIGTIE